LSSFTDLGLPASLSNVLSGLAIDTPTPIQRATLPDALSGRDVLGRGRTGSGKTLAFLLPVVARLSGGSRARSRMPRALILAPTRELAAQIDTALRPFAAAAGLTSRTVFGGVGQNPQVAALRRGVDILIACPGRLEDLIRQGHCTLERVEITVLDEADHMADLGFLPAVRRLLAQTPPSGQRMLFSATLDGAVDSLVRQFLTEPAIHEADSGQPPAGTVAHHVLQVEREHRLSVLVQLAGTPDRALVFARTKHGAKALAHQLNRAGVSAVELHGNLTQNARTRNLDAFHTGRASALVATDIAARGIHVDDVALVIHADPPADHKAYLHRSGRTARAGASGIVITLASSAQLREVGRLTRAACVTPTTTRITPANRAALAELVPGSVVRDVSSPVPSADRRNDHRPAGKQRRRTTKVRAGHEPAARTSRRRHTAPEPGKPSGAPNAPGSPKASVHSAAAFSAGRR
jgi:superfamily II DNA/RNA helicase